MLKRTWRRKIDEATRPHLDGSERLVTAFPAEKPASMPTDWLVDFLRRRYRVYIIALTESRVLILSRTAAFSSFRLTWKDARSDVFLSQWTDGRLTLQSKGTNDELDVEVGVSWRHEAKRLKDELASSRPRSE